MTMLLIRGMMRFIRGMVRLPLAVRVWLVVLGTANMAIPLAYLTRVEARVVFGVFVAAALLMGLITERWGFVRLLGVGHFVWFGLLPYLWTRLDRVAATDVYGVWLRAVIAVNMISLVFDVVDVFRYARGERAELVEGLTRVGAGRSAGR